MFKRQCFNALRDFLYQENLYQEKSLKLISCFHKFVYEPFNMYNC